MACAHQRQPSRGLRLTIQGLAVIQFALLCLCLLQAWDEVFVNLRHSYYLFRDNHFSFNANPPSEGTVDFLAYAIIGLLAKLGLPLLEGMFLMSFFGGLMCLYWSIRFLTLWSIPFASSCGLLALVWYAPLAFNASHGFATTFFTGFVLWACYEYWYGRPWKALALLALLPIIRIESAFLVFTILTVAHWEKKAFRKWLIEGAICAIPFLIHCGYRYYHYGQTIPLPVQYKAVTGNMFYFMVGMRNLAADMVASQIIVALSLILLIKKLPGFHSQGCRATRGAGGEEN